MQNEIWKDVPGFPGYQVSNAGRVKSFRSGIRILKQCNDGFGYPKVRIWGNGKGITIHVHKIVALAFIPNPDGKPEIDHINTIRTDNRVENLRWVTRKENTNNPVSISNYKKMTNIYTVNSRKRKPVCQIYDGKIIAEFDSIRDAGRSTGIAHQLIVSVLRGRSRVAGGYGWEYKK